MDKRTSRLATAAAVALVGLAMGAASPAWGATTTIDNVDAFLYGDTLAECAPSDGNDIQTLDDFNFGTGITAPFNISHSSHPADAVKQCGSGTATGKAQGNFTTSATIDPTSAALTLTETGSGTTSSDATATGSNSLCDDGQGNINARTAVAFTISEPMPYHFSFGGTFDQLNYDYHLVRTGPGPSTTIVNTAGSSASASGTLTPGSYDYAAGGGAGSSSVACQSSTGPESGPFSLSAQLTVGAPAPCGQGAVSSLMVGQALAEGCFTQRLDGSNQPTGVYETEDEAWVGGFDLKPLPNGKLVIEPGNQSAPLRAEGDGVSLVLGSLAVPAPLDEIHPFVPTYALGLNTAGSIEKFLVLPLVKDASASLTVTWAPGGTGATVAGSVSLDGLSKKMGKLVPDASLGTLAGKVSLKLANKAPADLTSAELQLPEFAVEIPDTDPPLKEGFGGATFKAKSVNGAVEWSGAVSTFFPFEDRQGSLSAQLSMRDSSLAGVGFGLTGLNFPLGATGWNLSGVNGNVLLSPEFGLDLGIEAVRPFKGTTTLFKMTGNLKALKLATDCKNGKNPFEFVGTTNAPPLEEKKIGKLKAQVLMCAYVPSARHFAFEAGLSGDLSLDVTALGHTAKKLVSASGSASGWFSGSDFNLDGSFKLEMPIIKTIAGTGLLSSEGYGICGQYGFISVGVATHNWLEAPEDIQGCDLTPFRVAAPATVAAAASGVRTVRIKKGQSLVGIAVRGSRAAPRVRVRGPGGAHFAAPGGKRALKTRRAIILPLDALHTTYVYLHKPRGGVWRILPGAKGGPIKRIDLARQLPKPHIKATIRKKGKRRLLTWKARRISGQKIVLVDRTASGTTRIQKLTSRRSGKLSFTPAGTGKHTIEAEITQNGIPRARLTIAHYKN